MSGKMQNLIAQFDRETRDLKEEARGLARELERSQIINREISKSNTKLFEDLKILKNSIMDHPLPLQR